MLEGLVICVAGDNTFFSDGNFYWPDRKKGYLLIWESLHAVNIRSVCSHEDVIHSREDVNHSREDANYSREDANYSREDVVRSHDGDTDLCEDARLCCLLIQHQLYSCLR